ncbi:hypothetical protein HCY52_15110 [Acinetobacter radioresistens]|uniref:hypothetical protein n=1 Tax=Acinetobacter radioresistens TaxID=40216 RepID=UPI0020044BB0|nr:hypothetical protein [Acinetobacter radioresistens]MCK4085142.1 hypothetical protein [Acinetobacter radioresistens]
MDTRELLAFNHKEEIKRLKTISKRLNMFARIYTVITIFSFALYVFFLTTEVFTPWLTPLVYLQLGFGVVYGIREIVEQKVFIKDIGILHTFNDLDGIPKDPLVTDRTKNANIYISSLFAMVSSAICFMIFHSMVNIAEITYKDLTFLDKSVLLVGATSFIYSLIYYVRYSRKEAELDVMAAYILYKMQKEKKIDSKDKEK